MQGGRKLEDVIERERGYKSLRNQKNKINQKSYKNNKNRMKKNMRAMTMNLKIICEKYIMRYQDTYNFNIQMFL